MTTEASHHYYNDDLDCLHTLPKQGAWSSKDRELDHSSHSSTLKLVEEFVLRRGTGHCTLGALWTLCPHLATEN